jgi:hypothetical protein
VDAARRLPRERRDVTAGAARETLEEGACPRGCAGPLHDDQPAAHQPGLRDVRARSRTSLRPAGRAWRCASSTRGVPWEQLAVPHFTRHAAQLISRTASSAFSRASVGAERAPARQPRTCAAPRSSASTLRAQCPS